MLKRTLGSLGLALALAAVGSSVRAADGRIDRSVLPIPAPAWQGAVAKTLAGSKGDWPERVASPQGAPNIVVILVDDAGFGNPSTFGGPVNTPALESLARAGLRFNGFHVTALCSPTRAALLSGQNHHSIGFGSIAELAGGWPG